MKKVYSGLPKVRVEPLHFAPEDISGDRLLAMMKVEESGRQSTHHSYFAPLDSCLICRDAVVYGSNHVDPTLHGTGL